MEIKTYEVSYVYHCTGMKKVTVRARNDEEAIEKADDIAEDADIELIDDYELSFVDVDEC